MGDGHSHSPDSRPRSSSHPEAAAPRTDA